MDGVCPKEPPIDLPPKTEIVVPEGYCITCEITRTYIDIADKYIDTISGLLVDPVRVLFTALISLWIVYSSIKFIAGNHTPQKFFMECIFVLIAFGLLTSVEGAELVKSIYKTSLDVMAQLSIVAITAGDSAPSLKPGETPFIQMIRATEKGISGVLAAAFEFFQNGAFYDARTYIYPALIIVPYALVVVLLFAKIVVSIFRLMILALSAPFLIMAFGFPWGRDLAKKGIISTVSSVMVMFATAAAVGLLLFGVNEFYPVGAFDKKAFQGDPYGSDSQLLAVIVLGWLGTGLMREGISLANTLTGSLLNDQASGTITGGVGASAGLAGAGGMFATKKLAGAAVPAAKLAMKAAKVAKNTLG